MRLQEVLSAAGRNKRKRRLGRGRASGAGKTSGRGHKGLGARSGATTRPGYEGGQNPQLRRIPKRGFSNKKFATPVEIVNTGQLAKAFEKGAVVDAAALADKGLIEDPKAVVKVLGEGQLDRPLTVRVARVSQSAAEKIASAGGKVELLG